MSDLKKLKLRHRLSKAARSGVGNMSRKRTRAGLLAVALGFTASVVAAPPAPPTTKAASASAIVHHRWFQVGSASWYGGKFQGKKTANGEHFDMNALTCAHRSLPMGSWVRVTNLRNQKTVFLRVNDRGPVAANLIMDLSYAAAQKLGIDGLGKVKVETVNDPEMAKELVASLPAAEPMPWSVARGLGR
jgi:rare lipoprotein A